METQTRYDLNAAIENWQSELAAQASLTPEVRRELETHLRDDIAGFRQRGLNDEESFWLACKRVGQPPRLAEEFVKANPDAVWRERGFWMMAAILLAFLWNGCAGILFCFMTNLITNFSIKYGFDSQWIVQNASFSTGLLMLLNVLPLLAFAMLLAKGRVREDSVLRFLARRRLVVSTLVSLWVIASGVMIYLNTVSYNKMVVENNVLMARVPLPHGAVRMTMTPHPAWTALSNNLIFPLLLLALVLWLMPKQKHTTSKRA